MISWLYARPLWQIVCAIFLFPILNGIAWKHNRKLCVCLSAAAAAAIIYITLLRRSAHSREIILIPFYSFVMAKKQPEIFREMLMNIFLFVPLGLFLPFTFKSKNVLKSIISAFILSLIIETVQYLFGLGLAEADDVLMNTLGTFIGSTSFWIAGRNK